LNGHRGNLIRPRVSPCLDFEGELVVVIGRHCRAVAVEEALDMVAGYTIGQEGRVRDWQRAAATPTAGKNFHRSGAMGPWLTTADEIGDPRALRLTTRLNGEIMQDATVGELLVDIPSLIAHVSAFTPLAPGDAIFTGTPLGTLSDQGGQRWLQPGDVVSVSVSGLGVLENTVVDES
jgi:2-keto-4-pentenoate hydratase/2-oxohepta-3-ene-1,7-dioic acid hydratase in catechol pathway